MTKEPKPFLHTLAGTGTANGQTGIRQCANGCPRKWWLDRQNGDGTQLSTKFELRVGSIGHAFMEVYYRTCDALLDTMRIKFTNDAVSDDDAARREAQRVFTAYQARFPSEEIGEVLSTEMLLSDNEEIDRAVGYPDYTARLDLVTNVTSGDITRFRTTRPDLSPLVPGKYGWDYKFIGYASEQVKIKYSEDMQPMFYQLAYNAMFPEEPLSGMILMLLTKGTKPEVHHVLVDPPGKTEQQMVQDVCGRALWIQENYEPPYPTNPDRCHDWGGCEYKKSGECWRV